MTPLQIRSIRQLVLIGFFISLIPLMALLYQSYRDFNDVSLRTKQDTQMFVSVTVNLQELLGVENDLQRLIKQYQIIQDAQLKRVVDALFDSFEDKLQELCRLTEQLDECRNLSSALPSMTSYHEFNDSLVVDAYLASLSQSMDRLQQQVNRFVDSRVQLQQQYLATIQQRQTWSSAALVLLSMLFLGFAVQFVAKPVHKLQQIIRAIATNNQALPARSKNAPRELMAVEKDLYWLNERLIHLEKVRFAMLRHASHELKTPLASMKEGSAILGEKLLGPLNNEQEEVLQLLDNSTQRLSVLIEKLLDYNALLQQAEPVLTPLKLAPMVEECVHRYRLLLTQNQQRIEVDIEPNILVIAEAELLNRIFDNLISNAVAYAMLNSTITVSAQMHRAPDQSLTIAILVKNMGKRINRSKRNELFEPFKRGHDARNDRVIGAGLGLSIVDDCVKLLNGDVQIIDVTDADVCFQIILPGVER